MEASVVDWLSLLALAGGMGLLGQGVRVVVGLKKEGEEAAAAKAPVRALLSGSRLALSLLLGFAAGAIAVFAVLVSGGEVVTAGKIGHETLMGFAAAGYAGADFIEGMAKRFLPKTEVAAQLDGAKQQAIAAKATSLGVAS